MANTTTNPSGYTFTTERDEQGHLNVAVYGVTIFDPLFVLDGYADELDTERLAMFLDSHASTMPTANVAGMVEWCEAKAEDFGSSLDAAVALAGVL